MSTSAKDESQAKALALAKERDEFAKLALDRGKALEVMLCCFLVWYTCNVKWLMAVLYYT